MPKQNILVFSLQKIKLKGKNNKKLCILLKSLKNTMIACLQKVPMKFMKFYLRIIPRVGIAKLNQRWLKKKSQEIIKKKDELEESAVESGLLENYEGEAYGQFNLNTPHFCNVTTYKFPHIDDKESEKNGSSILLESSYHADLMNETKSMDSSDYSPSTFYDTDVQESDRKTSDTSISHTLFLPKEERQSTV